MITMKVHEYISEMYGLDVTGLIEKTGMSVQDAASIFAGEKLTTEQALSLQKLGRSAASWIAMDRESRKWPEGEPTAKWKFVNVNPE